MTHGSAVGWRHHRCRCSACHQALLDEARIAWAIRRIKMGAEPASRSTAGRVRRRLAELEASGLTRAAVAARAGVSPSTISRIAKPTTKRVSRLVEAAVLAIDVP